MWFTEAEAKALKGQGVRVRDDSLWSKRIDKGAYGIVVNTYPPQQEGSRREEAGWGICLEIYLSRDHSLSVLLHNVSKGHYAGTFDEIPAQSSPRTAWIPPCSHPLPRPSRPACRETLTLVSPGGPLER